MNGVPALFLDRDGVINRERGEHTWREADFELLPDAVDAIVHAHAAGWPVIVITNQSGIGLGLYGHAEVEHLHALLRKAAEQRGARITAIYYCPHHPSRGKCLCRKPGGSLLERAIARYGIDPARSVMVGDRERDMQAAESVGVRGKLVPPNAPLLPVVLNEVLLA